MPQETNSKSRRSHESNQVRKRAWKSRPGAGPNFPKIWLACPPCTWLASPSCVLGIWKKENRNVVRRGYDRSTLTSYGRAPTRCRPGPSSCQLQRIAAASPPDRASGMRPFMHGCSGWKQKQSFWGCHLATSSWRCRALDSKRSLNNFKPFDLSRHRPIRAVPR